MKNGLVVHIGRLRCIIINLCYTLSEQLSHGVGAGESDSIAEILVEFLINFMLP